MGAELKILVGNVGSGKSTLAAKFGRRGDVVVNMDTIQSMLSGGEYGRYRSDLKQVYSACEDLIIRKSLEAGQSVVIDRTNMEPERRARFIKIGREYGAKIVAYDWGAGAQENLGRRLSNPRGKTEETWRMVFDNMRESYVAPNEVEGFDTIYRAPDRYRFYAFDFDGTIVEHAFPLIGAQIQPTVDRMKYYDEDISNIIIVWTCRSGDYEAQARQYMIDNGIPFDYVNENPIFDMGSPKIFAHEYYDDRNMPLP